MRPESPEELTPATARALAHVEVVSARALHDPVNATVPDGIAQLSWTNFDGLPKMVEVHVWRRIDQGLLSDGAEFEVNIQARQYRDLRLPLMSARAIMRLTLDPADEARLTVGDTRPGGWTFGVLARGARLLEAFGG